MLFRSQTGSVNHQFPRPSPVRGHQEFVGMVPFYHRFVLAAARIMRPLFPLLTSKRCDVLEKDHAMAAFDGAKKVLALVTMLVHPPPYSPNGGCL